MSDAVYSLTLLTSLLAGGSAFGCSLIPRITVVAQAQRRLRWRRWASRGSLLAWLALGISVCVHLAWGHRPGSPQALAPLDFLGEHRSFLIAAALPLLAGLIAGDGKARPG